MAATLLGNWPAGSPEWHAARTGLVMTGSRIAAAAGISPFDSPFSLYHRITGAVGEPEVSPEMEWGNRLEPAVVQKFRDNHPEMAVWSTGTWRNNERTWQQGTPDALIGTDHLEERAMADARPTRVPVGPASALLEAKTARYEDEWGTPGTDEIPVHYRAQVIWYLDTLGLDRAHVAVLIGGNDYREYVVEYDESEALQLRKIGRDFLDQIEHGVRPDIDGSEATRQVIKELHPDIEPTRVDVPDSIALPLFDAKYDHDAALLRFTEAKNRLADHIGQAHYAYWDGQRIADRRVKKFDGATPYMQLSRTLPIIVGEAS